MTLETMETSRWGGGGHAKISDPYMMGDGKSFHQVNKYLILISCVYFVVLR